MVEFRGVSKVYGRRAAGRVRVLADASFRVGPGEMVVLTGPTGAGKSTVFRLVAGEERPSRGTVLVDGEDVGALGPRGVARLRRRLGLIPQEPRLLPDRTVFGNVALVLRALGASRSEARARALAALCAAGLAAKPNALPRELAAGERQRLVIARALAGAPELVLADEPTTALEGAAAHEIVDLLRAMHARGATVLVATQTASLAAELGARMLRLDGGRVRADGSPHGAS